MIPSDPSQGDNFEERVKAVVHDLLSDTTKLPHVWSQLPGYLETNQPILQGLVNSQVSPSAAIAYSKLNLALAIVNADIALAAAIAYSKLALTNSIVNADIAAAAAIAYSKLNLAGSIVNADVSTSASVVPSKIAGYPTDATKFLRGDGTWAVPSSALTTATKSLTADVTMSASSTYFDGPPLTLGAGTWLLVGTLLYTDTTGSFTRATVKLWDGTTVFNSGEQYKPNNASEPVLFTLSAIVTGAATYKLSAASTVTTGSILAAAPDNGAGNNASTLNAVKVA